MQCICWEELKAYLHMGTANCFLCIPEDQSAFSWYFVCPEICLLPLVPTELAIILNQWLLKDVCITWLGCDNKNSSLDGLTQQTFSFVPPAPHLWGGGFAAGSPSGAQVDRGSSVLPLDLVTATKDETLEMRTWHLDVTAPKWPASVLITWMGRK